MPSVRAGRTAAAAGSAPSQRQPARPRHGAVAVGAGGDFRFYRTGGRLWRAHSRNTAAGACRGAGLALRPGTGLRVSAAATGLTDQPAAMPNSRSEEHTSELQSREKLVCRLLLE